MKNSLVSTFEHLPSLMYGLFLILGPVAIFTIIFIVMIGCSKISENGNNFIVSEKSCHDGSCFYHITNKNTEIIVKSDNSEFSLGDSVKIKRK